MPNCLTKRESVVEDKTSGLASFPPADMIACSNTGHQGFDALVGVTMGRPVKSLVGPFFISYKQRTAQGQPFWQYMMSLQNFSYFLLST